MGLLSEGTLLSWEETKDKARILREYGVQQFINIYNLFKNSKGDPFKWGDEIEFSLLKFDHQQKRAYLLLKSEHVLHSPKVKQYTDEIEQKYGCNLQPEYASYMVEATPGKCFDNCLNNFADLEENMRERRRLIERFLDKDEHCVSLTCFPMLGSPNFCWPIIKSTPNVGHGCSLFFPDQAIYQYHPRYLAIAKHVRQRRNSKVAIYLPIYHDKNTSIPFKEDLSPYDFNEDDVNYDLIKDDHIYLDASGFGMGCCCLQVTFQAQSINDARHIYDQLAPMTPILLALTASAPIWRGFLTNVNCRWNVISGAVDDRTQLERQFIDKSRYDSISSYLSEKGSKYNDILIVKDEEMYEKLIKNDVDPILAQHISHLFIRDPLVLFSEKITSIDEDDTDNFENIQSTNWQSLRFKPPPIKSNNSENKIGWRIEFRTMELQLTDFENSAFCALVILLAKAIRANDLNLLMPISKVDENMKTAQKINACSEEKFYFRKNIFDENNCQLVEMSINEIMNGSDDFKGILPILKEYLDSVSENLDPKSLNNLHSYMSFLEGRSNQTYLTTAAYIRKFVSNHPLYKHDSKINDEINYDLMWNLHLISSGEIECPELYRK